MNIPHPTPPAEEHAEETARERLAQALGSKYEVRELLGRGGFAEVYEVEDRQLHRRLAVKVLRPDLAWTQGMLQRFEKEARALASLSHANILPVHFVGDRGGLVYYAMPYIEGNSLGDLLRADGVLEPERAANLVRPILQALAHAHEKGMIHRDIKPDNIIVEKTTGRPLLVDFGIVKQAGDGPGNTLSGFVVGTPTYMSPEQALGQSNVDHRSDIYAMGGVLFHLVTGAPPYDGDTSQEVIGRHISQPVPVPSSVNTKVPVWLSDVILRALAKRPDARFQSTSEMADALRVGLRSGPQSPQVSRGSLARQIREDDPTHIMPAAPPEPGRAGLSTSETIAFGRRSSDSGRDRRTIGAVVRWTLVAGAVAAAMLYFILVKPEFVVRNNLSLPLIVRWKTGERRIAPDSTLAIEMPADGNMVAQWSVVRPRMGDSAPELGADYRDNVSVEGLNLTQTISRRVSVDVDSWAPSGDRYFAPLITNLTGQPVTVTVNPGASDPGCRCIVGPGERQPIGYYLLPDEGAVQVSSGNRFALYRNLNKLIDPVTGAVEILVDDASFQAD